MDVEYIRSLLSDEKNLHSLIDPLVEDKLKDYNINNDDNKEIKNIIAYQSKSILHNNIDIVEKYHESEIERIFLNSLNISALLGGLEYLISYINPPPPPTSAILFVKNFRQRQEDIEKMYLDYKKHFSGGPKDFENFISKTGKFSDNEIMTIKTHMILYRGFMSNAFHMILQANLPEFRLNNKGIRVDGYLWIPSLSNFNLAIECDGYKWHSAKDAFVADRKRDRLLKSKGWEIFRFSGTEIFNDPVQCGIEFVEYLTELQQRLVFPRKRS